MAKNAIQEYISKKCIYPIKCDFISGKPTSTNLRYHEEYEIHYIKKGAGYYFIKNKKYSFSHNNLIIIKSKEIHRFVSYDPPVYIEKRTLYISPSFMKNKVFKNIIDLSPSIINIEEKDATIIEFILKNISEEIEKKKINWKKIVHYQFIIFIYLLERIFSTHNEILTKNPIIEKITFYIEEHLAERITLSDISKAVFLSTNYISHLFKKETGLSVKQYILQRRIMEAKILLVKNPEQKLNVIAKNVGFSNFALFNRAFK
ncbi:MAG: AraC family transcriptional regulator, partial [Candidatus Omnitrophica bacterium]|nr:AraC family transcriptional regulator [Candidatus Omnitrophota bacterium]